MSESPPARKSNRETVLLLIVLGVGLIGLGGLYFSRQSAARAAEQALLQAKSDADARAADAQALQTIQKIPGDLLKVNTKAEAGTPYLFQMSNFAQGAVYELDMGDRKGRQPIVDGKLRYTYGTAGTYVVRLYARYQGQEALIDSLTKEVGNPVQVHQPANYYSD